MKIRMDSRGSIIKRALIGDNTIYKEIEKK